MPTPTEPRERAQFEARVLREVDFFEGDRGSTLDRCFGDTIRTARKLHRCHLCGESVAPGARHRHSTWKWTDHPAPMHYRWCMACCAAGLDDDYDALSRRLAARPGRASP